MISIDGSKKTVRLRNNSQKYILIDKSFRKTRYNKKMVYV